MHETNNWIIDNNENYNNNKANLVALIVVSHSDLSGTQKFLNRIQI